MESETLKEHLPLASHLNSVSMTFSARHSVTEVCRYSDCWAASNSDLSVTFDGKVRTGAQAECAAVQFARFRENCLCRTITPPPTLVSLASADANSLPGLCWCSAGYWSRCGCNRPQFGFGWWQHKQSWLFVSWRWEEPRRYIHSEEVFLLWVNDRASEGWRGWVKCHSSAAHKRAGVK